MKISMIYTGDIYGNHMWMARNHLPLIMELQKICEVETLNFTNDSDQTLDFVHAIDKSDGDIVIKMRTDMWFEESAVTAVVESVNKIIEGGIDRVYLSGDWLNGYRGQRFEIEEVTPETEQRSDVCVVARRSQPLNGLAKMISCRIWLIRKFYEEWPEDWQVCRDYIQSYLTDSEVEDSIQVAVDWWRRMLDYPPMKINKDDIERWQSE